MNMFFEPRAILSFMATATEDNEEEDLADINEIYIAGFMFVILTHTIFNIIANIKA